MFIKHNGLQRVANFVDRRGPDGLRRMFDAQPREASRIQTEAAPSFVWAPPPMSSSAPN